MKYREKLMNFIFYTILVNSVSTKVLAINQAEFGQNA